MFAQRFYVDDQPKVCFLPLEGMSILDHPVADALASFLSLAVLRLAPEKFQSIVKGLAAETSMGFWFLNFAVGVFIFSCNESSKEILGNIKFWIV